MNPVPTTHMPVAQMNVCVRACVYLCVHVCYCEQGDGQFDAKDESGNLVKDEDGNQVIDKGLKSIWVQKTKERANADLQSTDWYVTRKSEAGTAIPSNITTYRTAVRTASKTIEDKINACSDLAAFKKLFDAPTDGNGKPTGKAPIYDFPDEVTE